MPGTTSRRILDVATEHLGRDGYASLTLASVRDEANVSNGSLFHAFASKAALAAAVYVEGMAAYQRHATEAIERHGSPDAVRRLVAAHLGWVEDHGPLARYLFSTLPDEVMDAAADSLAERNDAFFAALDGFYASLTAVGAMGPLDRWTAHSICIGPAQEYCRQWVRRSTDRPPRSVTGVLAEGAVAALATTATTADTERSRP